MSDHESASTEELCERGEAQLHCIDAIKETTTGLRKSEGLEKSKKKSPFAWTVVVGTRRILGNSHGNCYVKNDLYLTYEKIQLLNWLKVSQWVLILDELVNVVIAFFEYFYIILWSPGRGEFLRLLNGRWCRTVHMKCLLSRVCPHLYDMECVLSRKFCFNCLRVIWLRSLFLGDECKQEGSSQV